MLRWLSIFFLTVTALWQASASVVLRGRVTDYSGEPLEGVTVSLGTGRGATLTDAKGMYRLTTADTDTLRASFRLLGYREERRTLLHPQGEMVISLRMRPDERELEEVTVTDIRKRTDAMERLDAREYGPRAGDPTGGSVEAMVATLPGVAGAGELSGRYSVRGGSYDENTVYVNGVEIYRPMLVASQQAEGLSVVNPEMTASVGFSSGGFAARYADRMSSVLDVAYRRPQAFEGSATVSMMGGALTLGQGSERFAQLHGVRYKRNTSVLSTSDTKGEYDPDFFDWQSCLSWSPSRRWRVEAFLDANLNTYRFAPADRNTSFGTLDDAHRFKVYFDGCEHDRFNAFTGAATVGYTTGNTDLSLQLSGFRTDELVAYDISGEYWLDQAGSELGAGRYAEHQRNRLKATVLSALFQGTTRLSSHRLLYSLGVKREHTEGRVSQWERRDSAGYSLPLAPDALRVYFALRGNHDVSTSLVSAVVQDTWQRQTSAGFWNVTGGIRATHRSSSGEFLVSPRLEAGLVPAGAPQWAFRLAGGVYYQLPFYREMLLRREISPGEYVTEVNSDVRSQRSLQIVGGADFNFRAFGRPFKFSAEAYYKALSKINPYEVENLTVTYLGRNAASGHVAGLDFKLFGQFVAGSDSWISFGLMDTRETLEGKSVPRPNDRRYNLSVYFTDFVPGVPRLKVSLRGVLMDGLITTAPGRTRYDGYFRTPPYKRVDLGLAYGIIMSETDGRRRAVRSLWAGIDLFNLFDITNVSNYYWVTDVNSISYAVPNYMTRRQINLRLTLDF